MTVPEPRRPGDPPAGEPPSRAGDVGGGVLVVVLGLPLAVLALAEVAWSASVPLQGPQSMVVGALFLLRVPVAFFLVLVAFASLTELMLGRDFPRWLRASLWTTCAGASLVLVAYGLSVVF